MIPTTREIEKEAGIDITAHAIAMMKEIVTDMTIEIETGMTIEIEVGIDTETTTEIFGIVTLCTDVLQYQPRLLLSIIV